MNEILITDLVAQQAMDQLAELDRSMDLTLNKFQSCARELASGLKINVAVTGDLDKLQQITQTQMQQATQAAQQYTQQMQQQQQVIANTTNTISRQLMAQENLNKATREGYTATNQWKASANAALGTASQNVAKLIELERALKANSAAIKQVEKDEKANAITQAEAIAKMQQLKEESLKLRAEKTELMKVINNEAKAAAVTEGSYRQMSLELERMRMALNSMTEAERNSASGQELLSHIQALDAHLKDLDADMGQFQRNVGNYAIALHGEARTAAEAKEQNALLAAEIERLKRESPQLKDQINALTQKMKQNEQVIKENEKALQQERQASSQLTDQLMQAVGINNQFGQSFIALGQNMAANGNILTGLTTKVKAFGKATLALLTNPYVLAIAGVGMSFKWWYDYNKGLIEATRQTKFFTGLVGEGMQAVRDKTQAVADAYGKDFVEVLKAATAISHNMGVTADEALDLISKGFAAGGENSQQFLSTLQRFAPTMEKMGMDADTFVAFAGQIEKAGADTAKSMTAVSKASLALRTMNKGTAESLRAIGIDAKKMSEEIQTGKTNVVQAMQEIATKIREVGTASKAGADVMKDLFGARGESNIGQEFLSFLEDAKVGTEELLGAENSLERLKVKEVETQTELNNLVASLFDMGDDGFEKMTYQAKIWIKEGLIAAIKWTVDLINYFIDWYNESVIVRGVVQSIFNTYRIGWNVAKTIFSMLIDAIKTVGRSLHALGKIMEGVFTVDFQKIGEGFGELMSNFKTTWKSIAADALEGGKAVANAWKTGFDKTMSDHVNRIDYSSLSNANTDDGYGGGTGGGSGKATFDEDKTKKDKSAEKAAKEAMKLLEKVNEAEVAAMEDGIEKTLATIRLKYKKQLNEIKGEGEKQTRLRILLMQQMENELAKAQKEYDDNRAAIDLANRIETLKKDHENYFKEKVKQLNIERDKEIEEAKKTGADVELIRLKYAQQEQELREEMGSNQVAEIEKNASRQIATINAASAQEIEALREKYLEEYKLAGNDEKKLAELKKQYERDVADFSAQTAIKAAEINLDALEQMVENENLSDEERKEIAQKLADAKVALAKAVNDAEEQQLNATTEAEKEAADKRKKLQQAWIDTIKDSIGKVSELIEQIYDNQISKIEELIDEEQLRHEKEIENIEEAAERGAITKEEAEIRKREAERRTAQQQEQLEKRKAEIAHKRAVVEKANSASQAAINTAVAIMQTLAQFGGGPWGIALAALVGAMGAVQIATILAQPIQAYAEGTKGKPHEGGLAIVGDGGRAEVVMYGKKAWITPDSPTLVDLPKGAQVLPDAERAVMRPDLLTAIPRDNISGQPVIINDYHALEERMMNNTKTLAKSLNGFRESMTRELRRQRFRDYINRRT